MTSDFPCTSCGACCMRIGSFKDGEDFALPSGRCKHLTNDNKCGIYDTRPEMCRIKNRAEKSAVSVNNYYRYFASVCNHLQKQQDMPVKFRVAIT